MTALMGVFSRENKRLFFWENTAFPKGHHRGRNRQQLLLMFSPYYRPPVFTSIVYLLFRIDRRQ